MPSLSTSHSPNLIITTAHPHASTPTPNLPREQLGADSAAILTWIPFLSTPSISLFVCPSVWAKKGIQTLPGPEG